MADAVARQNSDMEGGVGGHDLFPARACANEYGISGDRKTPSAHSREGGNPVMQTQIQLLLGPRFRGDERE
jgi:hypothetical protein